MKKEVFKKVSLSALTVSLLSSSFMPGISLVSNAATNESIQISNSLDLDYYRNSQYFDVTEENGKTIIEITDSNFIEYLKELGMDTSAFEQTLQQERAAGVTKIVIHSFWKGNADLYLSKGWLNTISAAGVGAIAGALGALLPGAGWGAAIGAIAGAISAQTFSHGKVFMMRSFLYSGSYNQ